MLMSLAHKDHLVQSWREALQRIDFAFQPIVSTHTGQAVGFEALLRRWDEAGFTSIQELFLRAGADGVILEVSVMLLERAVEAFREGPAGGDGLGRLFYNLDNRLFDSEEGCRRLFETLQSLPVPADRITLEISEHSPLPEGAYDADQLPRVRGAGSQVALDDFGTGYSGLQVLYRAGVDLIKLDHFFIHDLDREPTKRMFLTNIVRLAHTMGIRVVAEGVERDGEFVVCRDIGCDYVQGYLIDRPTTNRAAMSPYYPVAERLISGNRREWGGQRSGLLERLRELQPIHIDQPIIEVLQRFRTEQEVAFLPVVNDLGEPLGILREVDLKQYVYNPYGISLLMNHTYQREIYEYVRRVPMVAAGARLDHVLELYALDPEADAIIVTSNGRYRGLLDSRTLLQVVHDREVATARDQNPLTRLPGNTIITEHVAAIQAPNTRWSGLVYYDLNDFKPFNDRYGFRVGDRVIQLFADLLRSQMPERPGFVAHIGGDDFFAGFECDPAQLADKIAEVQAIVRRFAEDVVGFYRVEDRERGFIESHDREGESRRFPLLTASAAILLVPPHESTLAVQEVPREIAALKLSAKRVPGSIAVASLIPVVLRDQRNDGYR